MNNTATQNTDNNRIITQRIGSYVKTRPDSLTAIFRLSCSSPINNPRQPDVHRLRCRFDDHEHQGRNNIYVKSS